MSLFHEDAGKTNNKLPATNRKFAAEVEKVGGGEYFAELWVNSNWELIGHLVFIEIVGTKRSDCTLGLHIFPP